MRSAALLGILLAAFLGPAAAAKAPAPVAGDWSAKPKAGNAVAYGPWVALG